MAPTDPSTGPSTGPGTDLDLGDGRRVRVFDSHPGDAGRPVVYWHHGSPNIGAPPAPLDAVVEELGLRWLSHTRPGYPGSSRLPGRSIADVAADVVAVCDAAGVRSFATMGHSGGGAHALATAARLGSRVTAAVSISGMAPFVDPAGDGGGGGGTGGFDWFAGFGAGGEAELRAAAQGAEALEAHLTLDEESDVGLTVEDGVALDTDWAWFLDVVRPAVAEGPPPGFVDDDLAATRPWGADPGTITAPVLLLHGRLDRVVPAAHAERLAGVVRGAELWLRPDDGHITIMRSAGDALRWLAEHR